MQNVVYVDVLIFLNAIITFVILLTTSDIVKIDCNKVRFFIGSFTGGIFSLIILAPAINIFLLILIRIITCICIVLITFKIKERKKILKCIFGFILISFLYAGLVYGLTLVLKDIGLYVNNGYAYYDFSAIGLIVLTVLIYFAVKIIYYYLFNHNKNDIIFNVSIKYKGKSVSFFALYDSGNSVKDIYTGKPVIIVALNQIELLFSEDYIQKLKALLKSEQFTDELPEGVRFLPVLTIGNNSLLPLISIDSAIISNNNYHIELTKPCIAICEDCFNNEKYKALINDACLGKVL